ncbi:MAG: preprotein translocase subunit YajC [Spirochaetota bacterium]
MNLAFTTFIYLAQAADGQQKSGMSMLILVGLMFLFMYFFVIRPSKNEEKKRKEMLSNLAKGDQVVTNSGIHGKVVEFKDNNESVVLNVARDTNVTFTVNSVLKKK